MAFDNHVNLLIGTVKIAPSPSSTGETLPLMPGDGARFKPNMPVTLFAPDVFLPSHDNAEIAYVRTVNGDVLTVTRGTEGTHKLQVRFGWRVVGSSTAKTIEDLESAIALKLNAADLPDISGKANITYVDAQDAAEQAEREAADTALQVEIDEKYELPVSGVERSDLDASIRASLTKADTALQVAPVTSVNGKTGAVTVTKGDVGLPLAENTADLDKPVSTAQAAINVTKVDKVAGKGLSANDYVTVDRDKLAGIAPGATQNASNEALRERLTHTGAQAVSTVTGLQTALDAKAADTAVLHRTGDETASGTKRFNANDTYFGSGVGGTGGIVHVGNLGTNNGYIEAQSSDSNADLIFRAKGTGSVVAQAPVTLPGNPSSALQAAPKQYVDAAAAPDATATTNGKVRLAGELGGVGSTATSPVLKNVARVFNVLDYGAKPDARLGTGASTTSGSAAVTAVGATFSASDVGKRITIVGAGSGGADLRTSITSFTSPTQITLASNALTTVAGADYLYGSDVGAPLNAAATAAVAAGGGDVFIPAGSYMNNSTRVLLKPKVRFIGAGKGVTTHYGGVAGDYFFFNNVVGLLNSALVDMTIDGRNLTNASGAQFYYAQHCEVKGVEFKNYPTSGWHLKFGVGDADNDNTLCIGNKITDVDFDGTSGTAGLEMCLIFNMADTELTRVKFRNKTSNGPVLGLWQKCYNTKLRDLSFKDCVGGSTFYYSYTCDNTTIDGISFENTGSGLSGANTSDAGNFGATQVHGLNTPCLPRLSLGRSGRVRRRHAVGSSPVRGFRAISPSTPRSRRTSAPSTPIPTTRAGRVDRPNPTGSLHLADGR